MSLDFCTTPARGRERVTLGGAYSSMPPMGKWEIWDDCRALGVGLGGLVGTWFTASVEPGSGGSSGWHIHGRVGDAIGLGYWIWRDGVLLWGAGMDQTSTDFVPVYNQLNRWDVLRFRNDDTRAEWGPGIGHPTNPAQLTLRGGTGALPYLALAAVQVGTTVDGIQISQADGAHKTSSLAFGAGIGTPDWRLGEDLGAANTSEFGLWDTAAGAYRWQVSRSTGAFLIQAGGLGVPNRVAKTTLASPGTVTGAIEVFSAAGVSLGSVPVYANGSFS